MTLTTRYFFYYSEFHSQIDSSGGSKIFERRGENQCSIPPHRYLLQMHTTNYMPFIRKTAVFLQKNSEPIGGGEGGRPHCPPSLNLPLIDSVIAICNRVHLLHG